MIRAELQLGAYRFSADPALGSTWTYTLNLLASLA